MFVNRDSASTPAMGPLKVYKNCAKLRGLRINREVVRKISALSGGATPLGGLWIGEGNGFASHGTRY